MSTPELLLATAIVDVTPPAGHPMGGYVARTGVAQGTADPLQARMIRLYDRDNPGVLWLTIDALAVDGPLRARLATAAASAAGIPPERVLVCASHTHSAPAGWYGTIHPVLPAARDDELVTALVEKVAVARLDARGPVTARWFRAPVSGVGTNRHRIDGPHDASVGILCLQGKTSYSGGRSGSGGAEPPLAAVLFDFACHPTVHGPENLRWSADWPGATRYAVERRLGSAVVTAFLQGSAGDASPRFTRQGRGPAEVTRLGTLVADRMLEALAGPPSVDLEGGLGLDGDLGLDGGLGLDGDRAASAAPRLDRTTARLPVKRLPSDEAIAAGITAAERALDLAAAGPDGPDGPDARIAQTRLEGARGLAAMANADLPAALELPMSVVAWPETLAWVHLPVELFAALGARIVAASPFGQTRVIGYTDGYAGYVVDRAGSGTPSPAGFYEAYLSYFDAETTEALVRTAVELLDRAYRG